MIYFAFSATSSLHQLCRPSLRGQIGSGRFHLALASHQGPPVRQWALSFTETHPEPNMECRTSALLASAHSFVPWADSANSLPSSPAASFVLDAGLLARSLASKITCADAQLSRTKSRSVQLPAPARGSLPLGPFALVQTRAWRRTIEHSHRGHAGEQLTIQIICLLRGRRREVVHFGAHKGE